jgi:hypothetical protein
MMPEVDGLTRSHDPRKYRIQTKIKRIYCITKTQIHTRNWYVGCPACEEAQSII